MLYEDSSFLSCSHNIFILDHPPPNAVTIKKHNIMAMSPSKTDESHDEASTTHHKLNRKIATIAEEGSILDETGTTRHEPLLVQEEEMEDDVVEEALKQHDVSSRLNRKVAEIAAKAYRRASEQSNVLSRAKLADIALVKFDELEIGKFLGKGSFSNVHEITKISCHGANGDCDDDDDDASWNGMEQGDTGRATIVESNKVFVGTSKSTKPKGMKGTVNVGNPRKLLTMNHQRAESGTYRYAIKFLKEEIRSAPQKYAVGTADLVIEGMFLASLAHPNIIKCRGLPEGGVKSLVKGSSSHGYFLILDRLFDTLSDKIFGEWKEGHRMKLKKRFGFLASKEESAERNKHLAVRLKVAFDISAALKFLHSKSIIYRDLKPENLGFDVRGDIKLFDLGLVKELRPDEKDRNGNYRLSMAGTPRYMAPECGMYQPYNLSADVYSLSMLLWEILTLEKPLKDFTYSRLKNEIFIDGERPPVRKVFNKKLRALVCSGWDQNPRGRPSIDEMYDQLKAEYLKLAPRSTTEAEISHNRRRSTFVAVNLQGFSVRNFLRYDSTLPDDKKE